MGRDRGRGAIPKNTDLEKETYKRERESTMYVDVCRMLAINRMLF